MKKTKKQSDWLTPKEYNQGKQEVKIPGDELEEVIAEETMKRLTDVRESIREAISEQQKLRSQADDAGKFGEYRYRDGFIAGLNDADEIIGDHFRDLMGM